MKKIEITLQDVDASNQRYMDMQPICIPEVARPIMEECEAWKRVAAVLFTALREAVDHLDYTGYGDSWERECANDTSKGPSLPDRLAAAAKVAEDAGLE